MKIAGLNACALLRGVLLATVLTSTAGAQNQTWIRQVGSVAHEGVTAITPGGRGGVLLGGSTRGSLGGPNAGGEDAWLAHYDGAGIQTWIRQIGTADNDSVRAAAPDGVGGVFVGGNTDGSLGGPNVGGTDAWLARYDVAGNQAWIRQFGANWGNNVTAAAPDGAGGVFVSGTTLGSLGGPNAGSRDVWLAHYDGAGNQTWIRQIGTPSHDNVLAAAPDGSGGFYVSGTTTGNLGGPNAGISDVWLAHYDGAGNQSWLRQFGTSGFESANSLAMDDSGGVYVSGSVNDRSFGGPNAGRFDAWLARYDSGGNQVWIRQLGTFDDDAVRAAAPDGMGGVFASGFTDASLGGPNAGGTDVWVARYDGAGDQTWIRQFGTTDGDQVGAAASDGVGGVFVGGHTFGDLGGPNLGLSDAWLAHHDSLVAARYCSPAISNSTGQPGVLTATGSNAVAANNLTVVASQLPANSFGFFLTSRDQGSTFPVNNSQGRLCLGGFIGRYVGQGQIMNSGATGSFSLVLDLTTMAHPTNSVSVQSGQTWNFQAWHRDANPGPTSSFTDAVSVTFL